MKQKLLLHSPWPTSFSSTATAPTESSTLSLHDALPILPPRPGECGSCSHGNRVAARGSFSITDHPAGQKRSEEHTSELQSHHDLVCRLLLEKTKPRLPSTYDHVSC